MKVQTGLDRLISDPKLQKLIQGNISYICHNASITSDLNLGVISLQKIFKERLISIIGPQHGFVCDVQDNMVETTHFIHPYFMIPIYSLYSETRRPTDEMLKNVESIIFDLQDVGCRIYTYISTLKYVMEECKKRNIHIFVLDRPNPIGGLQIEGNILESEYKSFVGVSELPVRHALTMGEVAKYFNEHEKINANLTVIEMKGWNRSMYFDDTSLPWVNPSPNMASLEAAIFFPGTVIFEGTNISEGRGTTNSLQIIGHPLIEPFKFLNDLKKKNAFDKLDGFKLLPTVFRPTFQKHANTSCGGFLLKVICREKLNSWALSQILLREIKLLLGEDFKYKLPPYEYVHEKDPIDIINGSKNVKEWVNSYGSTKDLFDLEHKNQSDYLEKRKSVLIYK